MTSLTPRAQLAALLDAIALLDRATDTAIADPDASLVDIDLALGAWHWLSAQVADAREAVRRAEPLL